MYNITQSLLGKVKNHANLTKNRKNLFLLYNVCMYDYYIVYISAVTSWFKVLLPKLQPYLYSNGGPIISAQVCFFLNLFSNLPYKDIWKHISYDQKISLFLSSNFTFNNTTDPASFTDPAAPW